jgi:hypothetical protein
MAPAVPNTVGLEGYGQTACQFLQSAAPYEPQVVQLAGLGETFLQNAVPYEPKVVQLGGLGAAVSAKAGTPKEAVLAFQQRFNLLNKMYMSNTRPGVGLMNVGAGRMILPENGILTDSTLRALEWVTGMTSEQLINASAAVGKKIQGR